jgi:hypothetical protein
MPVIVDGDNLLGSWPGRTRSDAERRALSLEIARLARRVGRSIHIVYDGPPSPPPGLGPDVLFSGSGRSADDLIVDHLRRQQDRRGWIVVTNDRSLGDHCRWLGSRVERCDVFRKRLTATEEAEKPTGREEIDYWLDIFGE